MTDKDTDEDNDVTTIIFQAFKKAEPIMILASVSLAIGALVASQSKYVTIFNYSIISSFMFVFSFVFYASYELSKKYWQPTEELGPDEFSRSTFYYNMVRVAPIYFAGIGIMFLIIIAYEFGIGSTLQAAPQPSKNPLPIIPLVSLFFTSYFFVYLIYSLIKSTITWRETGGNSRNLGWLLRVSFSFIFLLFLELYIFGQLIEFPQLSNNKDLPKYAIYIAMSYGIAEFVRDIFYKYRWKRKYAVIALIIILLLIPFVLEFVLKGIGVLDKHFDIFEYVINTSRNILSHVNWRTVEVAKLPNNIADPSDKKIYLKLL